MTGRMLGTTFYVLATAALGFSQAAPIQIIDHQDQPIAILSSSQLDSLVAPIVLYPDPLLSQILTASTYPLEIVEAAQWLHQNPTLTGSALENTAKQQDWDPSVQALVLFPDVLQRLADNIRWTTDLGDAFLAQEGDVMSAMQRMRAQAVTSGALTTNAQTVVTTEPQGIVEVLPANPQLVYVPVYDPFSIWGTPFYPYPVVYYPRSPVVVSFGLISYPRGIFVGSFFNGWDGWDSWGWRPNWYNRTIVVNNDFFYRYGYRPVFIDSRRPTGLVVWRHNPEHRRSAPYVQHVQRAPEPARIPDNNRRAPAPVPQRVVRNAPQAPATAPSQPAAARSFSPPSSPASTTQARDRDDVKRLNPSAPAGITPSRHLEQRRAITEPQRPPAPAAPRPQTPPVQGLRGTTPAPQRPAEPARNESHREHESKEHAGAKRER